MKPWQLVLFGFFAGMLFTAALTSISAVPRGEPVQLKPAPTAAPLRVQVSGAVRLPGVYSLLPGSRVEDALVAAGGASPDADLSRLELTAFLADGERISIPAAGDGSIPETGSSLPDQEEHININTASAAQLQELPGIGETRANAVIAYRQANGPFQSIEEIQEVNGIGADTFEKLKDKITVK